MAYPKRAQWASHLGFILAAAGSAIGLGNIWKFPYVTGQNGGGAFVIVYLLCIFLIGLPLMMAEFLIGKSTRQDASSAFKQLEGKRTGWQGIGVLSLTAAFVILSYYMVVAGWTLDYIYMAVSGALTSGGAQNVQDLFGNLIGNGGRQVALQALFSILCFGIILGGIQAGIERWSRLLMPLLLIIMIFLVIYALMSDGAAQGLAFLFAPDFSKLTGNAILEAMGLAFFSLSLGMAAMITYGSYIRDQDQLLGSATKIVGLDTSIAMLSGLAIFPIVFAAGLEPGAGPGLVFQTIPVVFSKIPAGQLLAILFFLLLAFAALTSAISLMEALVTHAVDAWNWNRTRATLVIGSAVFIAGVPSALSYNVLGDLKLIGDRAVLDSADLLASNYFLPLAALFTSIYVGWFWKDAQTKKALIGGNTSWFYPLWNILIRFVCPLAISLVLYSKAQESGLFAWLFG